MLPMTLKASVASLASLILTVSMACAGEAPVSADKTASEAPASAAKAPKASAEAAPKSGTTLAIDIDLGRQHMTLTEYGQVVGSWPISSGREGHRSPTGSYRPLWSARMWYSKKYDNAPMPHAVFFSGGVAMHATQATGMLGHPASHGCIRQSPANAAMTYRLVEKHGNSHTRITVHGTPHDYEPRVARHVAPQYEPTPVRVAMRRSSPAQHAAAERSVAMRRVILVDGYGNRRVAEIRADDPRLRGL